VQDGVHELTGGVSGKGTAGAVAAVSSRGEAENEDAGVGVSEAGDGTGPIGAIEIGAALLGSDALAVLDESRTTFAVDYVTVQEFEGSRAVHWDIPGFCNREELSLLQFWGYVLDRDVVFGLVMSSTLTEVMGWLR
jgi:hypothetical protein